MATTAEYLNKLVEQKNTLADNLVTKGVDATHDETLEILIPKVLEISGEGGGVDLKVGDKRTCDSYATGWRLNPNGCSETNNDYNIIKYKVVEGSVIYVKAMDTRNIAYMWFQSTANVTSVYPNNYIVGEIYNTPVDGYFAVPSGASYLMLSQHKEDMETGIYTVNLL